jgi:hypothetical protein
MGRVLRRLSRPLKIRGFLVGLGRCDAKTMDLPLFHTLLQIRLQTAFLTSLASDCNPPAKVCKEGFKCEPGQLSQHPVAQRQFPAMKT